MILRCLVQSVDLRVSRPNTPRAADTEEKEKSEIYRTANERTRWVTEQMEKKEKKRREDGMPMVVYNVSS